MLKQYIVTNITDYAISIGSVTVLSNSQKIVLSDRDTLEKLKNDEVILYRSVNESEESVSDDQKKQIRHRKSKHIESE